MQVFDASSMIYGWDNYPVEQFPGLWQWLADLVARQEIRLPSVALEEVGHKAPECAQWLRGHGHEAIGINNDILQRAARMKQLIGVVNDLYHPKGVDENDLLIIATAAHVGQELISDESRQQIPPDSNAKRKIPAVCSLPEVGVPCINFLEYIKRSGSVFR